MSASDLFKYLADLFDEARAAIATSPQVFAALTGAFCAAILALLFNTLLEYIKRRISKEPLLDLFIADLAATVLDVKSFSFASLAEKDKSRTTAGFREISGLSFKGEPELFFEVYNVKLYESEGFKLAAILKSNTRREFWRTYKLMRDAESARLVLKGVAPDDPDRQSFERLYRGLLELLYTRMLALNKALDKERFWFRPFAPLS